MSRKVNKTKQSIYLVAICELFYSWKQYMTKVSESQNSQVGKEGS